MSEIIAETNGKQGIILADTMITQFDDNHVVIKRWDERKIYLEHYSKNIFACAGSMIVGKSVVEVIESREGILSTDLYSIFDGYLDESLKAGIDASSSILFEMYTESDNVRIIYCRKNREKRVLELSNQKIVVMPGDAQRRSYIQECNTRNLHSREHLAKLVQEFIDVSEKSQYVSDTCCITTMNCSGVIQYYEDNMYNMLDNLRNGKAKSDIGTLAKSTPRFIRYGVQNPIL